MTIERIQVGFLETNCYIITKNNRSIIIDPGDEFEKIKAACMNKCVVGILVTHHHFDHVGVLKECEDYFNVKHNEKQASDFDYKIIKTPGHSKDSISFYFEKENVLFAGDFIFQHGIGRCDLPSGNFKEMQESIKNILNYPKSLQIYPGHGDETVLKKELNYLSYLI